MQINGDLLDMAKNRYGYGKWEAPYWFIGLEEGMDPAESNDLRERISVWRSLGSLSLDDCRAFHNRLFGLIRKVNRYHRDRPVPALEPTWNQLIRTLLAFHGESSEEKCRREYQRVSWGSLTGETCVIEVSGLPAPE